MSYIGNSPTQGSITGGNIVDGSIESIDLATLTNIDINSGSIDGTIIGASSAAAGTFSGLTVNGDSKLKNGSTTTSTNGVDFIANSTARLVTNHANEYGAYIGYINSSNDAVAINSMRSNGVGGPLSLNTFGGNVGIGTTSPSTALDVNGTVTANSLSGSLNTFSTASSNAITANNNFRVDIDASNTSSIREFAVTHDGGTETLFTVNETGNVGIGTNAPNYKLVVSDSGGAGLEFIPQTSNNRVTLLSYDRISNAYRQVGIDGAETRFYTNGTERVRVATNGNLLVGTTNSPSITNSLSVGGRMFSAGTYANNSGAGANLGIASSGEIYRSTSSLKYKTDVQDAQHGLTEVMTLRPVTYRGINDGDAVFGGLIAEEVHDAGLTEFVEYNEDNEPDALAYANMVSLCIKAIQDQQEIIESLKTRIETLENTGA